MSKAVPQKSSRGAVDQKASAVPAGYVDVRSGIVELLNAARQAAARNVNALMTASYWEIGRRIVEAEQKGKRRAGYGEQLMERLSTDLTRSLDVALAPTTWRTCAVSSWHTLSPRFPRHCLGNLDTSCVTKFPRQCLGN